jgi:putative ABC transport system ATP-binding protein
MGELAMLVGPSGCGKTTLISIIAGLLDATEGELEVLSTRPQELKPEEKIVFRRKNLGFVFQQFNLLPTLTAAENVAVPLFVAGFPRPRRLKKLRICSMNWDWAITSAICLRSSREGSNSGSRLLAR